jgi:hypothetical protein
LPSRVPSTFQFSLSSEIAHSPPTDDPEPNSGGIGTAAIIGIVVAGFALVLGLILLALRRIAHRRSAESRRALDLESSFTEGRIS